MQQERHGLAVPEGGQGESGVRHVGGLAGQVAAQNGGEPRLREGFVTDNGNLILDVAGLAITDPVALEGTLDQIVGVVTNGLFARRGADVLLLGTPAGVRTMIRP